MTASGNCSAGGCHADPFPATRRHTRGCQARSRRQRRASSSDVLPGRPPEPQHLRALLAVAGEVRRQPRGRRVAGGRSASRRPPQADRPNRTAPPAAATPRRSGSHRATASAASGPVAASASSSSRSGPGNCTFAHTPAAPDPAPSRCDNRCANQRSTPFAGTATISGANASPAGCPSSPARASTSASGEAERCTCNIGPTACQLPPTIAFPVCVVRWDHACVLVPEGLTTPCLLVEAAVLEANIAAMARRAQELGAGLRPHAKTHKCLEIAVRQLAAGAVGLTVATVAEAEVFAAVCDDLFIAYPVWVDARRGARLRALAERARVRVGVDSAESAQALARQVGDAVAVLVEVDSGHHRSGVDPSRPARSPRPRPGPGSPCAGCSRSPGTPTRPGAVAPAAGDEAAARWPPPRPSCARPVCPWRSAAAVRRRAAATRPRCRGGDRAAPRRLCVRRRAATRTRCDRPGRGGVGRGRYRGQPLRRPGDSRCRQQGSGRRPTGLGQSGFGYRPGPPRSAASSRCPSTTPHCAGRANFPRSGARSRWCRTTSVQRGESWPTNC